MKPSELQKVTEGPCDIALPSEDDEEDVWTKNFKRNAAKRLRQRKYRDDQQADEFEEGYMISGDWQNLDIDHDDLEVDDAFPGDSVWSVGRGGAPSKYFYFTAQNTSTHFATIVDMGRGAFKVEDETGKAVHGGSEYRRNTGKFGLTWAEAEAAVRKVYDMQNVEEGHRTLPPIDTERYTERKGLEGPMRARNGRVVYYDPKEGQYYDGDTDIYITNDEWEEMNESSPAPDGPDYKQGDLVVMPNGRSYVLDEYDDGIWWAVDDDGGDIEFEPGTELHHEPMSESEDDNVVSALDTMRTHLHDYEHDPSDRWEKYNQYRNQRKQISKRAKDLK